MVRTLPDRLYVPFPDQSKGVRLKAPPFTNRLDHADRFERGLAV